VPLSHIRCAVLSLEAGECLCQGSSQDCVAFLSVEEVPAHRSPGRFSLDGTQQYAGAVLDVDLIVEAVPPLTDVILEQEPRRRR
jgi:hypothetical protein